MLHFWGKKNGCNDIYIYDNSELYPVNMLFLLKHNFYGDVQRTDRELSHLVQPQLPGAQYQQNQEANMDAGAKKQHLLYILDASNTSLTMSTAPKWAPPRLMSSIQYLTKCDIWSQFSLLFQRSGAWYWIMTRKVFLRYDVTIKLNFDLFNIKCHLGMQLTIIFIID